MKTKKRLLMLLCGIMFISLSAASAQAQSQYKWQINNNNVYGVSINLYLSITVYETYSTLPTTYSLERTINAGTSDYGYINDATGFVSYSFEIRSPQYGGIFRGTDQSFNSANYLVNTSHSLVNAYLYWNRSLTNSIMDFDLIRK